MLVPRHGSDDLGQQAEATISFLRYSLTLRYRAADEGPMSERLEVAREELRHINIGEARESLRFEHSTSWRASVVAGRRAGGAFLSTEGDSGDRVVKLHQDKAGGRPRALLARNLPRTVLSSANAVESPTALLARREMQSWRLLQLEPSALRASDSFSAPTRIGKDGSHLAATLYHLATLENGHRVTPIDEPAVYSRVANRLAELVEDVRRVTVDKDERRELLTLQVLDRDHRMHAARALSDGTLRFLALAILELDPEAQGLLCFEEPENGIHPQRIPIMLQLLNDLCVDVQEPVGTDNPLRQVIINTHSPGVVAAVNDDDLLLAEPCEVVLSGARTSAIRFAWLDDTWRAKARSEERPIARGHLIAYLNPLATHQANDAHAALSGQSQSKKRRVIDRTDLQMMLPNFLVRE